MSTVILITGANRGIGLGLVKKYVARPDTTVVAAVRDPSKTSSKDLTSLSTGKGSKVIVVKIDSIDTDTPAAAIKVLTTQHGIKHLDLVIANAGMADFYPSALETPMKGFNDHLAVNTIAPLALFQATWPLLQVASNPKFVTVSSVVGSIGDMDKFPTSAAAYGTSKAALNFLTKSIHRENPSLTAFPIHPGWVQTDMGNAGAVASGMTQAPTTINESIDGIVSQIDASTREKTSGTFVSFDASQFNW